MEELWTRYENKNGLSIKQRYIFKITLNELKRKYPKIIIESIGDFYTRDRNNYNSAIESIISYYGKDSEKYIEKFKSNVPEVEFDKYELYKIGGIYDNSKKSIFINQSTVKSYELHDNYLNYRNNELKLISKNKTFEVLGGTTIENLVTHEFGHAIGDQYDIYSYPDLVKLFESENEKDNIAIELSDYAKSNIHEFLAEGFVEFSLPNSRILGVKIGKIINKVVSESNPISETEKLIKKAIKQIENKE